MAVNLLYDLPPKIQALVLLKMLESYKTRKLHCTDHLPFYGWYGSKTLDMNYILITLTCIGKNEIKRAYRYPDYGIKLAPNMHTWSYRSWL